MRRFLEAKNKQGWNTSQYYSRAVKDCQLGLKDLAFLAQKLPESRQVECFSAETLRPTIQAILKTKDKSKTGIDLRHLRIAIMIVRQGLYECLRQMDNPYYNVLFGTDIQRINGWLRGMEIGMGIEYEESKEEDVFI
jgi:hypothetical protein